MPRALKTLTNGQFICAYDTAILSEINGMIGVNQLITVTFPDGSTYAFWGWVDEFTPSELVDGTQPTATCTIICSNMNDSSVETDPVYTAA